MLAKGSTSRSSQGAEAHVFPNWFGQTKERVRLNTSANILTCFHGSVFVAERDLWESRPVLLSDLPVLARYRY